MTKLYENIKQLCKERKISIRQLERDTRLSRNTISHWANSFPSVDKVQLIANYFDVSIDYLMGDCMNPLSHKDGVCPKNLNFMKAIENLDIDKETTDFVIDLVKLFIKHKNGKQIV